MGFIEQLESWTVGQYLITFFVSMVPVIELRGAIPIGVSMGMPLWAAMITSVLGNMVPVPFIILFIRRIFAWMRKKLPKLNSFVDRMERKVDKNRAFIEKWEVIGLTLFVAVPLPGTGAWTGALIAALMDIRLKHALPCIFLGVLIASLLVSGITYGFTAIF